MMDASSYLLGLATLPAVAGLLVALAWTYWTVQALLEKRGWTWEFKTDRKPHEISDYDLRRYIWFERQRGPIFTGHWWRIDLRDDRAYATRWIGVGSARGRSVMFYHKRDLG